MKFGNFVCEEVSEGNFKSPRRNSPLQVYAAS